MFGGSLNLAQPRLMGKKTAWGGPRDMRVKPGGAVISIIAAGITTTDTVVPGAQFLKLFTIDHSTLDDCTTCDGGVDSFLLQHGN